MKGVIVIDDDNLILSSLQQIFDRYFSEENIVFEYATTANEAFDIYDEFSDNNIELKLVITDYHLSKLNGFDVINLFDEKHKNGDLGFIILTGEFALENKDFNEKTNIFVVAKPWNSIELTRRVAVMLDENDNHLL